MALSQNSVWVMLVGLLGGSTFCIASFPLLEEGERLECKKHAEAQMAGLPYDDRVPIFTIYDRNGLIIKRRCPGCLVSQQTPAGGFAMIRQDLL